jgi:hypothetical protein
MGNAGTGKAREEVFAEVADIANNPNNPRHKLYQLQDPKTMEYVDSLYAQLPGAREKVTIG